jgi:adenylate cyclase
MPFPQTIAHYHKATTSWLCRYCRELRERSLQALLRLHHPSLGFKWSAAVVLLVATSLGMFGAVVIHQNQQSLALQIDRLGSAMASQLAATAAEPLLADDNLALSVMLERLSNQDGVLGAAIHGTGRAPLHAGIRCGSDADCATDITWRWQNSDGLVRTARNYSAPILFGETRVGHALVTLDADTLDQGLNLSLWNLSIAALLLIVLAVTAAAALARHLAKPLKTLSQIGGSMDKELPAALDTASGSEEIDRIVGVFNRLAVGMQEKQHLEKLLHCYVPLPLADSRLREPLHPVPHARPAVGSVLFCDVCGFTALSESLPPERIAGLLNDYFFYITSAAHACGGVVDSFIGDCIMVVFAGEQEDPLHALHAATCALLIRETVLRLNQLRSRSDELPLQFRTGVNSGPIAVCHLGGQERMQPTVIGDTVNVAARLCSQCKPGEIILGEHTAESPQLRERLRLTPLERRTLRGRQQITAPYRAEALAPDHQSQLHEILDRILPLENS